MIKPLQVLMVIHMGLVNLLKSIFAGNPRPSQSNDEASEAIEYKGFSIEAAPINTDGKFRTAGYISGEIDAEVRRVQFIRADETSDRQAAIDHSISKARQIIDEQGVKLLHKSHL